MDVLADPVLAFTVAAAIHAGFQVTVTGVVYPALADVSDDDWSRAHARHSTRIGRVVAVVYPLVLAASVWLLVAEPLTTAAVLALGGTALALGATAFVAAPTHGRLARGRTPQLIRLLLRADGVRTLGAVLGLIGALLL